MDTIATEHLMERPPGSDAMKRKLIRYSMPARRRSLTAFRSGGHLLSPPLQMRKIAV